MKVVIIGAGGLVGTEFTRHLSSEHEVLPLTHDDLDVRDAQAVRRIIFDERPALIINCAVLGVDACELDPQSAWAVNAVGAGHLAKAAATIDADILQLSTNYVFDGQRASNSFYTLTMPPGISLIVAFRFDFPTFERRQRHEPLCS
jgi:dTDP-4-dehydrorhamnose reductase